MEANRLKRQGRLSRRAALVGMGLSGATLAAMACRSEERLASPPASEQVAQQPQPKRGGSIRYSSSPGGVFDGGIDPHKVVGTDSGRLSLMYQTLLRINPRTFNPEPEVAQKWEQPSESQYIFTLNPGIKWHNKPPVGGRALTAQDVVFSLDRMRSNEPQFVYRSLLASTERIEAVNNSTIRLTTRVPDAGVLGSLSAFAACLVAPEVVQQYDGKFASAESGVGTGPFMLRSMDETSANFARNPDYWKSGLPYLDSVVLASIKDANTGWAALLGGALDIYDAPGGDSKKFLAEQGKNYSAEWFPSSTMHFIHQNVQRKPFDDARVTRALRLLIDHQEAVASWAEPWYGRGRHSTAFSSQLEDWDFTDVEYAQFLEWKTPKDEAAREALRLLGAAGFSRETPLRFSLLGADTSFIQSANQLLQAQIRRLSQDVVQPELRFVESPVRNTEIARGNFDFSASSDSAPLPEPDVGLRTFFSTNAGRNFGKYSDTGLDQLIDRQRSTFDTQRRKALVKDILRYLQENSPYAVFSNRYVLNVAQSKVKDRAPDSALSYMIGFQYEHVWLDA